MGGLISEATKSGFPQAEHRRFDGGFVLQQHRFVLSSWEPVPVDQRIFLLELENIEAKNKISCQTPPNPWAVQGGAWFPARMGTSTRGTARDSAATLGQSHSPLCLSSQLIHNESKGVLLALHLLGK